MEINYEEIKGLIKNNLLEVMEENYNFYRDYNIEVEIEQHFIKRTKVDPKTIYIVIKFNKASVSFGQTVLPITITAISEENKVNICQNLFTEFSRKYNLKRNSDSTIQQVYESPDVMTNFNNVYAGFRSTFVISGLLVISKNANFFTYYYLKNLYPTIKDVKAYYEDSTQLLNVNIEVVDKNKTLEKARNEKTILYCDFSKSYNEDGTYTEIYNLSNNDLFYSKEDFENAYGLKIATDEIYLASYTGSFSINIDFEEEEIPTLQQTFDGVTQLDTQALYETNNFTTSVAKVGTLSLSFSIYLLDDISIVNDSLSVYMQDMEEISDGIENRFKIKISFKNGKSTIKEFRLVTCGGTQVIGDIPTISLNFTQ